MSKGSAQEIVGEIMNPTVEGRYPSLDRRIRAKIAGAIIAPIALTGCSMEAAPFSNTGMEIRNDALNPDRITALIETVTSIREQGGNIQYSKDNPDHVLEEFVDPDDYIIDDDDYFEGIDDDENF